MSDNEIITSILGGDKNQFRFLVEKYQQLVFRTCMGFLHGKDDAEDLTQDIFISAYQSLNKFKGQSAFSTWLYRIAVNASLNTVRKRSGNPFLVRIGLMSGSDKEMDVSILNFDPEDPEKILIRQEHSKWIQDALDSLPENQRTAIVLSKYDDLPQREIAVIMKTTEGAVEALIQRAKKNLREKLILSLKKSRKTP